jgi:hypothetical protein
MSLAVLAVFITVFGKSMNATSKWYKPVIILCGSIMLCLIIFQAITTQEQEIVANREKQEQKNKTDDLTKSLANVQGQLVTMSQFIAAQTPNPSQRVPQLSKELQQYIRTFSNYQLWTIVWEFTGDMNDFEDKFEKEERQRLSLLIPQSMGGPFKMTIEDNEKEWHQELITSAQRYIEFNNEFRRRFLTNALTYRNELLRRLNTVPPEQEKGVIALQGYLAGSKPILQLSNYLNGLALSLPKDMTPLPPLRVPK